jgi:hypothetical protein
MLGEVGGEAGDACGTNCLCGWKLGVCTIVRAVKKAVLWRVCRHHLLWLCM